MHNIITRFFLLIIFSLYLVDAWQPEAEGCVRKSFGYGSFVCVCNISQCHSLKAISSPLAGQIIAVVSSKDSDRWTVHEEVMSSEISEDEVDVILKFNKTKKFQTILGFGGAFTDASGINIQSVPQKLQDKIIRSYFDSAGLEYNLGRIPIGGTDFSTHPYSYNDMPPGQVDPYLKKFALAKEDLNFKIPFIQQALKLNSKRGVQMRLYGSPWSGPAWMKDNGQINGKGKLLQKYYPAYASYIIRFIEAYEKYGIPIFGVTTQNEPTTGFIANYPFNTMGWMPEDQADWIGNHLGPQLRHAGLQNVSIFILDDARVLLPQWAVKILENEEAAKYVGGIAVHWYWDWLGPPEILDLTHNYFPNLPILYTEACTGSTFWDLQHVLPGSWVRAEYYAADIIENLQHWVVGWTDWNLALNLEGGPNWVQNFVDSPVLVNQETQEAYKQPMYYALAHFSKILPEGSVRIETLAEGKRKNYLKVVTFKRPDGAYASILLNRNREPLSVDIQDNGRGYRMTQQPRSIVSLIWKN